MTRVLASDLSKHVNSKVKVKGWLHNTRSLGKINFLILRDRSGLAQIVVEDKESFKSIKPLFPGSILSVNADVKASSQAGLGVELINPEITIEQPVLEPPPLEYYKPDFSAELDT